MSLDLEITLRAVISSISDGIYMTDAQGYCIAHNDAFLRITGIPIDAILGKHVKSLLDEHLISDSVTLDAIRTGQRVSKTIVYPTGCEALVTGNPIIDENRILYAVVCVVRDLSELNTLKDELKQTKQLNKQYKELLNYHTSKIVNPKKMIVHDPKMEAILDLLPRIADSDATVLIYGESGVGKGLIASLIHEHSNRSSNGQFIKVDCSAIPASLMESELFGYEGGAFTGARKEGKPGLLELAHHGTVFLDEIGELPLLLQVKLLSMLQDRTILRVGGTKPLPVDSRIISATNRDLEQMVEEGRFRSDLYYRLNVVPVAIPPLRERKEDIMALLISFLDRFCEKYHRTLSTTSESLDCLLEYAWPGNVRELENTVERLVVLNQNGIIKLDDLPEKIRRASKMVGVKPNRVITQQIMPLKRAVSLTEKNLIERAFQQDNRLGPTAQVLGIDVSTLLRKCKRLGIRRADSGETA